MVTLQCSVAVSQIFGYFSSSIYKYGSAQAFNTILKTSASVILS